MTITGTVTAPAAAAKGGVTGTALAPATSPYVVTPVADKPSWRRHMPCDPGPCRRVPNAPIRIMKPSTSGWRAEPAVSGTTDSNGDFSITVDKDALTKGGPVFIAAWDPDGTFTFMSTIPADLVKAGATLNLPVDRTTTAAAVMHCPGGVYPPPRGGYCYSDPKESTDIEALNSEIDRYFADNPSTTDFDAYFPALLNDAHVMEALGQVLEANDIPAASAQQVLDSITELPTVPSGPSVAGGDKFQFTAPSTLTATAGEEFKYSFCDPEPVHNTSPCGPMPATSNPTGGNPAYHFVLGSGTGFPPFGLSLSKDGVLKGKVAKSEAGKTKTIEVCAVDLNADAVCRQVTIIVSAPPPPSPCAGAAYENTTWSGTFKSVGREGNTLYTATFEFTFGSPTFSSSGCTVPVVRATINDAARRWAIDAKAVDPPRASELICSATACREFHLVFGVPGGPGVPKLGGATALRLDAPSIAFDSGPSTLSATTMRGSAGAGGYGGGCCWAGDFTANRR